MSPVAPVLPAEKRPLGCKINRMNRKKTVSLLKEYLAFAFYMKLYDCVEEKLVVKEVLKKVEDDFIHNDIFDGTIECISADPSGWGSVGGTSRRDLGLNESRTKNRHPKKCWGYPPGVVQKPDDNVTHV
ncbi:hypothetical protein IFM89_037092 [Coptis chinensis]|uniref:Uncharacterized protein n=1 Tax=Coptis chinensis TaxID=261450 RepID=A0A835LPT8_9MAGN|nr:hypothetical protein IFM89_037092 [Coptis chinensis]